VASGLEVPTPLPRSQNPKSHAGVEAGITREGWHVTFADWIREIGPMGSFKRKARIFRRGTEPDICSLGALPKPHVVTLLDSVQAPLVPKIGRYSV
jgi:hypothetical protein